MIFVIFPAYNEEKVIRPTLLALAAAYRGREHEVRAVHSSSPYTRRARRSSGTLYARKQQV